MNVKNRLFPGLTFLLIVLALFHSACQQVPPTLPTQTPALITLTPIPSQTASAPEPSTPKLTPSLVATLTPGPSATSAPSLLLTETHSRISYVSPLTVQHVTQKSVVCSFELDEMLEGYLFYWPSLEGMQEMKREPLQGDGTRVVVKIEQLVPGIEYEFAVGLVDQNGSYMTPSFREATWGPIRVRTLREERWPMLVGVFGDSGFGQDITFKLAQQMASYDLDFILHTGDIVYRVYDNQNVQEAYALKYFEPLAPILNRYPLYPVPGNHEYDVEAMVEDRPYYFHVFPGLLDAEAFISRDSGERKWYAVEVGSLQFLMLDTQLFWRGTGRSDQTAWLQERLLDERFQVSIPVFHVPPFTSGKHKNDGRFVQTDWVPLFEKANVPLVLSGHDHNYERLYRNGINYIVTGGGSSILYPQSNPLPESQYFARRTHFVLLEIHADRIRLAAITPKGEILDQVVVGFSE